MAGDVIAWVLGIAALVLLAAGERNLRKTRRAYHRSLIGDFEEKFEETDHAAGT